MIDHGLILFFHCNSLQHHWFNAETNTGFLENSNVGLQRSDKKLTGRGIRRSKKNPRQPRKLVEIPTNSVETQADDPDPIEFTRNVSKFVSLFFFFFFN